MTVSVEGGRCNTRKWAFLVVNWATANGLVRQSASTVRPKCRAKITNRFQQALVVAQSIEMTFYISAKISGVASNYYTLFLLQLLFSLGEPSYELRSGSPLVH